MTLPAESFETDSVVATEQAGVGLAERWPDCRLFLLEGELGAGKTVFVRGLARAFGVDPDEVCSPTFAILNEYGEGPTGSPLLRHLDLYRVEAAAELRETGVLEMIGDSVPMAVEWPREWLPVEHACRVRIELLDDDRRRFLIGAA